jgi:protein required for attachment to host cells
MPAEDVGEPQPGDGNQRPTDEDGAMANVHPPEVWILLADSRQARLLCGRRTPQGRPHLDEIARLENPPMDHEHGRPSPLGGKDSHAYASLGHEEEEHQSRFANKVAGWIAKEVKNGNGGLAVCAPSRFLGALRKVLPERLKHQVREHEGEFANLSTGDLARHQTIAAMF